MTHTTTPHYWTKQMPPYISPEGWQFEKERAAKVIRLQVRFAKINRMINKTELMRKAALICGDTFKLLKYVDIEIRLLEARGRIAETLIYDYREPLTIN